MLKVPVLSGVDLQESALARSTIGEAMTEDKAKERRVREANMLMLIEVVEE